MNKKAQELPLKTIVTLILAIIVLVVLILAFSGGVSPIITKIMNVIKDVIGTTEVIPKQ